MASIFHALWCSGLESRLIIGLNGFFSIWTVRIRLMILRSFNRILRFWLHRIILRLRLSITPLRLWLSIWCLLLCEFIVFGQILCLRILRPILLTGLTRSRISLRLYWIRPWRLIRQANIRIIWLTMGIRSRLLRELIRIHVRRCLFDGDKRAIELSICFVWGSGEHNPEY